MKVKIVKLLNCYIARSLTKRFSYLSNLQQFNHLTIEQFQPGQALVILLVFVATATIITAAAVTVTIINSQTTGKLAVGEETLAVAEGGAEYAVSRILLSPNYLPTCASPDVITIGSGTATICIIGVASKQITSTGQVGNFTRKVQVTCNYSNLTLSGCSWQEIN